jgi:hypothetical protein
MKRFVIGSLLAFGGFGTLASAQDVRGLGMGGALVPGPSLAVFNPAYSVYPSDGRGGGLVLPLGLLNFFVNPQMNVIDFISNPSRYANPGDPSSPEFNALAAFDQATHLNTFILNPVPAPRQINVNVSSTGVTLTDQNGTPLAYNFSSGASANLSSGASAVGATPLFRIPFGIGALNFGLGLFFNFSGPSLSVNPALQNDLIARGGTLEPNKNYEDAVTGQVQGAAGISFDAAFALPFDVPGARIYAGGRGAGFFGLAYVDVQASGSVRADASGSLTSATPTYEINVFRADPTNGGFGFGVNLDLGVAADLPSATLGVPELEKLTVGLGIVGAVDTYTWNGQEQTITASGTSSPVAATRGSFAFNPLVTLNAAGTFSLQGGLRVLAVTDIQFGRGVFAAHLGAEAQFGMFLARAGLGVENGGFRFGLGGGVEFAPGLGFDLALTTHQAPFYNHTSFGIALAARFGF